MTTVSRKLGEKIAERDGWICNGCGTRVQRGGKGATLATIDHKTPVSRGGGDEEENLWLLCSLCNGSKGQQTVAEWESNTLDFSGSFLRRGFTAVPNGFLWAPGLSIGAKMTFICLLSHAWNGDPFPGQKRLAAMLGCSDRTVREYLGELREADALRSEQRGRGKTAVYRINQGFLLSAKAADDQGDDEAGAEDSSGAPRQARNSASGLARKPASGPSIYEEDEVEEDKSEAGAESSAPARVRDELWDELAVLFGDVADKTNAHAKRNRAVSDLRRLGADVSSLRRAVRRWPMSYPGATLTDVALATHYPQLSIAPAGSVNSTPPPVSEVVDLPELSDEERAANLERVRELAKGVQGA